MVLVKRFIINDARRPQIKIRLKSHLMTVGLGLGNSKMEKSSLTLYYINLAHVPSFNSQMFDWNSLFQSCQEKRCNGIISTTSKGFAPPVR
jgi:hypothetical protein